MQAKLRRCYLLGHPSSLNYAMFLMAKRRCSTFFEVCKVGKLGKAPQMWSIPSSFVFELCKAFHCPRKSHARLFRLWEICKLGKAPQMPSAPSSFIFELCSFLLPDKELCTLLCIMQGSRAGQGSADATCSVLHHFPIMRSFFTAQGRVMQSFPNYAKLATWARLRRYYLLRPHSFLNYARRLTA